MDNPNIVFMWTPWVKSQWARDEYRSKYSTLNCFFEPLTNCTIELNKNGEFPNYTIIFPFSCKFQLPQVLVNILSKSLIHQDFAEWYWYISVSTYIFRLNKRTFECLNNYEKTHLLNAINEYDVGIHVRHGDKFKEMILIDEKKIHVCS